MSSERSLYSRMCRMSVSLATTPEALREAWGDVADDGAALPERPVRCGGCPADGPFRPQADALASLPPDVATAASKRWWCHNRTSAPCAGMLARLSAVHPNQGNSDAD